MDIFAVLMFLLWGGKLRYALNMCKSHVYGTLFEHENLYKYTLSNCVFFLQKHQTIIYFLLFYQHTNVQISIIII